MTTYEERNRQEVARRLAALKGLAVPPVFADEGPLGAAEQQVDVKNLDEALEEAMRVLYEALGALREEVQPTPPSSEAERVREVAQQVEQAIGLLRRLRAGMSQ